MKKLVKTLGAAIVAAAALGGAAAIGGTIFESPPKDLADWAERVEAGSRHADPNRARPQKSKSEKKKSGDADADRKPTTAERRYARTLSAWCIEQERDVAALGRFYTIGDFLALSRGWRSRVAALEAPPAFRDERERYLRAWAKLDTIAVQMARANAANDSVAGLEAYDRWVHTAAAQSDAALSMGADACAGWLLQGVTTIS